MKSVLSDGEGSSPKCLLHPASISPGVIIFFITNYLFGYGFGCSKSLLLNQFIEKFLIIGITIGVHNSRYNNMSPAILGLYLEDI